jgi:hypothetical protein
VTFGPTLTTCLGAGLCTSLCLTLSTVRLGLLDHGSWGRLYRCFVGDGSLLQTSTLNKCAPLDPWLTLLHGGMFFLGFLTTAYAMVSSPSSHVILIASMACSFWSSTSSPSSSSGARHMKYPV